MMRMLLVFFTNGTVTTCEVAALEKDCLVTSPCHNEESLLLTIAVPSSARLYILSILHCSSSIEDSPAVTKGTENEASLFKPAQVIR